MQHVFFHEIIQPVSDLLGPDPLNETELFSSYTDFIDVSVMWFASFITADCVSDVSVYVGVWLWWNWGLSHLTKMIHIACRVMIGEHPDLLRTLFCCESSASEPGPFCYSAPFQSSMLKKRAVVWEFLLFLPHFKSKLLHCGSSLYDHCEPSGINGQSHRNWAIRAVSAWRAHRPQGTFLSSGSCWEADIFGLFSLLETNKFIRSNHSEVTSFKF